MRICASSLVLAFCCFTTLCSAQIPDRFPDRSIGARSPQDELLRGRINSVSGVVLGADGKPLSDVHVELRREDTGATIVQGYTNDSGAFEFDRLPTASCELVATHGQDQARQHVTLVAGETNLKIRLNTSGAGAQADGTATVSVAEYKVPQKARDAFHKAQEALAKSKQDEAKKQLAKSLDAYPDYAPALTLRGVLTLDEGSTQSAINDFDHAIHSDPGFALAYTAMAAGLNRLGKFDEALRSASRAVTLAPATWQAYFEMAQASVGTADYSHALQHLAKAEGLAPKDFPPIHLVRAHAMLGLKDYSNAATELEAFIKLAPHHPTSAAAREALQKIRALTASAASQASSGTPK